MGGMGAGTGQMVCPHCGQPRDLAAFFSEARGRPVRWCLDCRVAGADSKAGRKYRGWPPEAIAAVAEATREATRLKLAAGILRCPTCQTDWPVEAFRQQSTGRSRVCLGCEHEAAREHRRRRQKEAEAIAAITAARQRVRTARVEEWPCCSGDLSGGHDRACPFGSLATATR